MVDTGAAIVSAAEQNILLTTRNEAILTDFNRKYSHLHARNIMLVKPRTPSQWAKMAAGRRPGCKYNETSDSKSEQSEILHAIVWIDKKNSDKIQTIYYVYILNENTFTE